MVVMNLRGASLILGSALVLALWYVGGRNPFLVGIAVYVVVVAAGPYNYAISARASVMPRDGAITFRDIVGKLHVLRITCDKCGRSGQYRVDRLILRYGIDAKLFDWEPDADCPRKVARNEHDPCGARCPDLSKVV